MMLSTHDVLNTECKSYEYRALETGRSLHHTAVPLAGALLYSSRTASTEIKSVLLLLSANKYPNIGYISICCCVLLYKISNTAVSHTAAVPVSCHYCCTAGLLVLRTVHVSHPVYTNEWNCCCRGHTSITESVRLLGVCSSERRLLLLLPTWLTFTCFLYPYCKYCLSNYLRFFNATYSSTCGLGEHEQR